MFQDTIENSIGFGKAIYMRANFADKLTVEPTIGATVVSGVTYWFLQYPYLMIKMTSQFTNKTKVIATGILPTYANSSTGTELDWKRQLVANFFYTTGGRGTEDLTDGKVHVATDEFPLGFYDITIYENKTSAFDNNLANATATLFNGVLNLKGSESDTANVNMESVQYVDYTTNDTETQSVYITF